jgi:hypothetical protein
VRTIYSTGWPFMTCISSEGKYYFNPVVLDSCLHALVHPAFTRNLDKSVYYLPSSVQRVSLHKSFIQQKLPSTLYAYAELRQWNPGLHIFMPVFQSTHPPLSRIYNLGFVYNRRTWFQNLHTHQTVSVASSNQSSYSFRESLQTCIPSEGEPATLHDFQL